MPSWIPSSIGLQGMMNQIHGTDTRPSGPYLGDTGHSQDFDEWLSGLPFGNAPWDLAPLAIWMQQHDPQMAAWMMAYPGLALPVLGVWAHDPKYRDILHQYWQEQVKTKPSAPTAETTPGTNGATPAVVGASGTVPQPFPYAQFSDPSYRGYNYGDQAPPHSYVSGWHEGQDYGVKNNTPLVAPFGGKVRVGYDASGYGNWIDLVFGDQGMYLRFSHLGYINVKDGDEITPGMQLGLTGSTGYSTGPHLLVELRNNKNQPLDPRPLMSAIFNKGTPPSFASLQDLGVGQIGTPNQNANIEYTPDGKPLYAGSPDRAYYDMVNYVYQQKYGTSAPWSIIMGMRAAGVTNSSQMAAVAANWPSDIPGVTFGTRDNIYSIANGIAMKQWGRPIPDSLVKQLANLGYTSPEEIKTWFMDHVPSEMPAAEYQQVYDAAAPPILDKYGEPPSPAYIGYLWGKTQTPTEPSHREPGGGPGGSAPGLE